MKVTKFLGASLVDFNASANWGAFPSAVNITLVEDTQNFDHFLEPKVGTPASLSTGSFRFDGLVRSVESGLSTDGRLFKVLLTAPTDLLDGTQLILSDYYGTIGSFNNLFNIYGLYENQYGPNGSLVTDLGFLWDSTTFIASGNPLVPSGWVITPAGNLGIRPGVQTLQSGLSTAYGSGIYFMNNHYNINFNNFPAAPQGYRVGAGSTISLGEAIDGFFRDGGYEYIVGMTVASSVTQPHQINFKYVLKSGQPPLGQIQTFLNAQSGIASWSAGKEMRNADTSLFLVGGNVQTLYQQNSSTLILPFFGLNSFGNVALGVGTGDDMTFTVNGLAVSDLTGTSDYDLTIGECRAALGGFDMWSAYLIQTDPSFATTMGLVSCFSPTDVPGFTPVFAHDFVQQNETAAVTFGAANSDSTWAANLERLYQFVLNYATEFYGRKYLVTSPTQIYQFLNPQSNQVEYSLQPCDGGWVDPGSFPLGLTYNNETYFQNLDGTFGHFVAFNNVTNADFSTLTSANTILQGTVLYMPCRVLSEYGILYYNGISAIPIELESPLFNLPDDSLGSLSSIDTIFGLTDNQWADVRDTYAPVYYHPDRIDPTAAAIAMHDPRSRYGNWGSVGPPGKTQIRVESSLVPWEYGSTATMNAAANAIIQNFVTNSQIEEQGQIELVGLPQHSLGDQLVSDGPIITNISCQESRGGFLTRYELRTYTPRAGQFSRDNAERIRKAGQASALINKGLRRTQNAINDSRQFMSTTNMGFSFNDNTSIGISRHSPQAALVSHVIQDVRDSTKTVTTVSNQTFHEAVGNMRADNVAIFKSGAMCGLDFIYRPFSTNTAEATMPHYVTALTGLLNNTRITVKELNPVQQGDLTFAAFGDTYSGLHLGKNPDADLNNARLLGIKFPMMGIGFGFDVTGKPVPNINGDINSASGYQSLGTSFNDNYLKDTRTHKAGPVDFRWDAYRGVWTSPTHFIKGKLLGDCAANGGTQKINLMVNNVVRTNHQFTVENIYNTIIPSGSTVGAIYDTYENAFVIISASCST